VEPAEGLTGAPKIMVNFLSIGDSKRFLRPAFFSVTNASAKKYFRIFSLTGNPRLLSPAYGDELWITSGKYLK
jgi:hypothetical protein